MGDIAQSDPLPLIVGRCGESQGTARRPPRAARRQHQGNRMRGRRARAGRPRSPRTQCRGRRGWPEQLASIVPTSTRLTRFVTVATTSLRRCAGQVPRHAPSQSHRVEDASGGDRVVKARDTHDQGAQAAPRSLALPPRAVPMRTTPPLANPVALGGGDECGPGASRGGGSAGSFSGPRSPPQSHLPAVLAHVTCECNTREDGTPDDESEADPIEDDHVWRLLLRLRVLPGRWIAARDLPDRGFPCGDDPFRFEAAHHAEADLRDDVAECAALDRVGVRQCACSC